MLIKELTMQYKCLNRWDVQVIHNYTIVLKNSWRHDKTQ